MLLINYLIVFLLGYLLGSLPTAYLVTLFVKRINIFEVGSGNMGGTNVARTMGLHWGIFTAILDIGKGMVAVYLAQLLIPDQWLFASIVAAVAAVAGHNWSLFATWFYLRFQGEFEIRGGKGAATAFGTMLMLLPPFPIVMLLAVGIALAITTRYSSLAVLVSYAITFIWTLGWSLFNADLPTDYRLYSVYAVLMAVLIVWRFRENIERLLNGTERKLGERVA